MIKGVFVFGSNLAGRHGVGAARYAVLNYGAIYGVGEGRQNSSYAIPTKDANLKSLSVSKIEKSFYRFTIHAREHRNEVFLLTPIGCGLAGNSPVEIWDMMHSIKIPQNVVLLSSWINDHSMINKAGKA